MKILVLEDNAERRDAMRASLEDRFRQYDVEFASTAPQMIEKIGRHWTDTLVIALDHDLELIPGEQGKLIDPGTGRDVADYLAAHEPFCPVVIHTTNSPAAIGMQAVLEETGWKTARVLPLSGTDWIPTIWIRTVRDIVVSTVPVFSAEAW